MVMNSQQQRDSDDGCCGYLAALLCCCCCLGEFLVLSPSTCGLRCEKNCVVDKWCHICLCFSGVDEGLFHYFAPDLKKNCAFHEWCDIRSLCFPGMVGGLLRYFDPDLAQDILLSSPPGPYCTLLCLKQQNSSRSYIIVKGLMLPCTGTPGGGRSLQGAGNKSFL